jgi:hypothetical protein
LVVIWAGSGEVYLVHHQAYGGDGFLPDGTSGVDPSTTSPSFSTANGGASMDISTVAGVAAAVIAAVAVTTLLIKKRKK